MSLEHESPVTQRFTSEMIVVGLYRLVRLFNPRCALDRVGFAYPAPDYRGEYERILGGPVSFDQPRTSFMFDGALMSSASPFRDPDLHDALRALVQRRVLLLSESTPYALRARDHLARHDAPHQLDMASVARSLGLSERSLRRRLAEEGTAYDALQDEACGIVVQRLLLERRCTIQEAAFEMGFTSTTAFHRAFKRWTGMTPSAFRASRTSLRQTTA